MKNKLQVGLKELYELGDAIKKVENLAQDIGPSEALGPFVLKEFITKRSGTPKVVGNIILPITAYTTKLYRDTEIQANAVSSSTFIRCRNTGLVDLDGFVIYQGENDVLFIYKYIVATETEPWDVGIFASPRLNLNEYMELYQGFEKTAEIVINEVLPDLDLYQRLVLINRFRDLQVAAHIQGQGVSWSENIIQKEDEIRRIHNSGKISEL